MNKTETTETTIFGIIDLGKSIHEQKTFIIHSLEIAKQMNKKMVFYPKTSTISFDSARAVVLSLLPTTIENVSVSKKKINSLNFFTSMCDIAKKENAKLIIIGVSKDQSKSWRKEISTAEKSLIPILLVPDGAPFAPINNIVIAADSAFKLQKTNEAIRFAKIFGAKIIVFKENNLHDQKIAIITRQITRYLADAEVTFEVVVAEEDKNFAKNMCKYASKYAQLLIIEVNPGKIDETTKRNISKLMSIDTYASSIPVLITKTKETMKPTGRF